MVQRRLAVLLMLLSLYILTECRPSNSEKKEMGRTKRQVQGQRQIVGGLSTLGALIQPILFMIGVANFMGRLPTFFTRVRDRLSHGLAASGAPAGAGRKKRSLYAPEQLVENLDHALNTLEDVEQKYHMKS